MEAKPESHSTAMETIELEFPRGVDHASAVRMLQGLATLLKLRDEQE